METDFSESMSQLQTDLDNAMDKMDQSDEAYQSGINTIQGYINGSEEMRKSLVDKYTSLGNAATAAYNAAVKVESRRKYSGRAAGIRFRALSLALRMSGQNYSGRIVTWAIRLFLPMMRRWKILHPPDDEWRMCMTW